MTPRLAVEVESERSPDSFSSPPGSPGFGLDAKQEIIGGDVKRGAVVAPVAVAGLFAGVDAADEFSGGGDHPDAAEGAGPDVAIFVGLDPIA